MGVTSGYDLADSIQENKSVCFFFKIISESDLYCKGSKCDRVCCGSAGEVTLPRIVRGETVK